MNPASKATPVASSNGPEIARSVGFTHLRVGSCPDHVATGVTFCVLLMCAEVPTNAALWVTSRLLSVSACIVPG